MIRCGKIGIDCEWCDYKNECFSENKTLKDVLKQKAHDTWKQNNPEEAFKQQQKIGYKIEFNKLVDSLYNYIKDYDYSSTKGEPLGLFYNTESYYEDLKDESTYGIYIPYTFTYKPFLGYRTIMNIESLLAKKLDVSLVIIFRSPIIQIDPLKINTLIFIKP